MFDPEDDHVEFMRKIFIFSNIFNDNKENHIQDNNTTQPISSNKKTIRKFIIECVAILILILIFFLSI